MIVTLAVRVLQLLFGAVALALSAVLIKGYGPGKGPALIDYGAFCGGAGVVFAAIGVLACFVQGLQGMIILALDGIATFFLLAGGLAFAITMKVGSCTNLDYLADHAKTLVPSIYKDYAGNPRGDDFARAYLKDTENRCRMIQADTAFVWFLFACFAATLALSFTTSSRGRGAAMY